MPFVQNFNFSSTGSVYGMRLLNNLFPFTHTASDQGSVYVMFFALKKICEWLTSFAKNKLMDKEKEYRTAELTESWNKISSNLKANVIEFLELIMGKKITKFKVQSLMGKDGTIVFDTLRTFIENANESFKHWTDENIKDFKNHIITQLNLFKTLTAVALPKIPLKDAFGKMTELFGRTDNSPIDLISGLGQLMVVFVDNQEKFLAISEDKKYKDRDFDMLSKIEQNNIATLFGYGEKEEFEKDSILGGLFALFNDPENKANKQINDLLLNPEDYLYELNISYYKFIHEALLQYAVDENYWKVLSKSFEMEGAITGKNSLRAKFNYSLEYNGKGDKTVTKFLDKPVKLPDNFDPVIPWTSKTDVSEGWTAQDYIDYTGLGNGELKDVNFKYDIQWSNLSDIPDFPYWVITKIDCFN